jgi:hypothetical protein
MHVSQFYQNCTQSAQNTLEDNTQAAGSESLTYMNFGVLSIESDNSLFETSMEMAQVVIYWFLTAEAWVCTQISLCTIYGRQSGTGTGFSPRSSVFHVNINSTRAPYSRTRG